VFTVEATAGLPDTDRVLYRLRRNEPGT